MNVTVFEYSPTRRLRTERKRSGFGAEQIIAILKEPEAGMATAEVGRRHGIGSATFYKWKLKFGGLNVSEARRLRTLEDENARLKKLLAEAMQSGFVENFNGRLRDECLHKTLFTSMAHVRFVLDAWRNDCNHVRLHPKLGGKTPAEKAAQHVWGIPRTCSH